MMDVFKQIDEMKRKHQQQQDMTKSAVESQFSGGTPWRYPRQPNNGKFRASHKVHGVIEERTPEALLDRIKAINQKLHDYDAQKYAPLKR